MKAWIVGLVLSAVMAVQADASFVTLDEFNGGSVGKNFLSGFSSTVTGGNFSGNSFGVFGGGASIVYNYTGPGAGKDINAYAPNWLLTFDVSSVFVPTTVSVSVNNGAAVSTLITGAGFNSLNFLDAAANQSLVSKVQIDFSAGGIIVVDRILATPEPASLLTAGAFSLIGGLVYRRRKAVKTAV